MARRRRAGAPPGLARPARALPAPAPGRPLRLRGDREPPDRCPRPPVRRDRLGVPAEVREPERLRADPRPDPGRDVPRPPGRRRARGPAVPAVDEHPRDGVRRRGRGDGHRRRLHAGPGGGTPGGHRPDRPGRLVRRGARRPRGLVRAAVQLRSFAGPARVDPGRGRRPVRADLARTAGPRAVRGRPRPGHRGRFPRGGCDRRVRPLVGRPPAPRLRRPRAPPGDRAVLARVGPRPRGAAPPARRRLARRDRALRARPEAPVRLVDGRVRRRSDDVAPGVARRPTELGLSVLVRSGTRRSPRRRCSSSATSPRRGRSWGGSSTGSAPPVGGIGRTSTSSTASTERSTSPSGRCRTLPGSSAPARSGSATGRTPSSSSTSMASSSMRRTSSPRSTRASCRGRRSARSSTSPTRSSSGGPRPTAGSGRSGAPRATSFTRS